MGVSGTAVRQMARSETAMLQMKRFVPVHRSRFLNKEMKYKGVQKAL